MTNFLEEIQSRREAYEVALLEYEKQIQGKEKKKYKMDELLKEYRKEFLSVIGYLKDTEDLIKRILKANIKE